jgi:hypothetical protein
MYTYYWFIGGNGMISIKKNINVLRIIYFLKSLSLLHFDFLIPRTEK